MGNLNALGSLFGYYLIGYWPDCPYKKIQGFLIIGVKMKIDRLHGVIELFLENENKMNNKKDQKYWYPLSMATYGVDEIIEALDSMCNFRTTMWEKTALFEKRFEEYIGCSHAVMVNSGSSADLILMYLLRDLVSKNKDTIIIPAVTWPTQIWSAICAGFKVKIVDVDPKTFNIDYNSLEKALDDQVAGVFLVHLMGNPCNVAKIKQIITKSGHDIKIMEDCCEGLGSTIENVHIGNFGLGGSFSFFFSHHITTMEGGMVIVNSEELAQRAKVLRAHGWTRNVSLSNHFNIDSRYTFVDLGFNLRPTELQAGFGIHQLKKLESFNRQRNLLYNKVADFITTEPYLTMPISFGNPSWLGIPFMVDTKAPFTRKDIINFLEKEGIETRPIVAGNIMKQPVASKVSLICNESLLGASEIHDRGFYIGLSPIFNEEQIDKLISIFKDFIKNK